MFTKYSVEGPILSIEDKDGTQNIEAPNNDVKEQMNRIVVCKKCGIQHMLIDDEKEKTCMCGYEMRLE
jgi:hypothetical protein